MIELCWKDKFKSVKKARKAARVRGKRLGCVFHVYECKKCGKGTYHLTKYSKKDVKCLNKRRGSKM